MLSITATVSRASCYAARSRDTYNVTEYNPQNTHQRAHRPACHDKTHRERTYSISQSQLTAVSRAHNEQPTTSQLNTIVPRTHDRCRLRYSRRQRKSISSCLFIHSFVLRSGRHVCGWVAVVLWEQMGGRNTRREGGWTTHDDSDTHQSVSRRAGRRSIHVYPMMHRLTDRQSDEWSTQPGRCLH